MNVFFFFFGNMDQRGQDVRERRGRPRAVVSDEIRTTIIIVVNHGLSLREAGLRVQPTDASILSIFQQ